MVSDHDKFFFDLRGFIVIRGALSAAEVAQINAGLDAIPPLEPGEWFGHIHGQRYAASDGINYQQIYEAGEPFERLIDHPAWIEHVKTFVGGQGTFDMHHGPIFIDETFANFRNPGQSIPFHGGGHTGCKRTQYRFHNGKFQCGQVNVILALTDIGPGDGSTMLVPGSHKCNFEHPDIAKIGWGEGKSVDGVEGAIEVHVNAGDALVFVDAIMHGSARRMNDGQRRILVQRYGPSWGMFRHGYRPSEELLKRLTPERRQIVWPHNELVREPQVQPAHKA